MSLWKQREIINENSEFISAWNEKYLFIFTTNSRLHADVFN